MLVSRLKGAVVIKGIKMKYLLSVFLVICCAEISAAAEVFSPGVDADYPKQVYFGDLHLHSNNSADSFSMGNRGLSAADAYRFARGEEISATHGLRARLKRPLDFLAVTDHAEFIGLYRIFYERNPQFMETDLAKQWLALTAKSDDAQVRSEHYRAFPNSITDPDPERDAWPKELKTNIWRGVTRVADEFNDPGTFTTFSGYEWTSMTDGNNLHRCVIFKDESDVVAQVLPFSAQQSIDPEDLWKALAQYEDTTGGRVLAIPHNGNLSNGIMWDTETLSGKRLSKTYAETRMRWEPIAEVTQVKGDSETHPLLAPTDEFADFERWDKYNIMNTAETTPDMLPGSYARSALQTGLGFQQKLGVNPYKFGMIGSTDDHTGLATAAEDNFFGKFANSEPAVRTADTKMAGAQMPDWQLGASGLAAVWAQNNTRADLFAAMERKEVYATTGSRIALRFFAGWDYAPKTIYAPDFVKRGYAGGVPMGGELPQQRDADAPTFLVQALKDPDDANLDRIQIVKGWVDRKGEQQHRVFDVALSDGRSVDPETGKAPPVGSTVDFQNVSYSNEIGAAQLSAQWTDPEFDERQPAFYYARVIEIPKPRWTEYDRKFFGIQAPDAPKTVQDRAYSSPIWFTP